MTRSKAAGERQHSGHGRDGINDAPALAQADIGIAIDTGTDVAIESAKMTLVKGDLKGILQARNLSHAVMRNIKQNLFFAFFYNALGIPVAAGVLYPSFELLRSLMNAALAMSLSSVFVILNAQINKWISCCQKSSGSAATGSNNSSIRSENSNSSVLMINALMTNKFTGRAAEKK
ncbi:hypothetical protein [Mucilaginibacter pineti]